MEKQRIKFHETSWKERLKKGQLQNILFHSFVVSCALCTVSERTEVIIITILPCHIPITFPQPELKKERLKTIKMVF